MELDALGILFGCEILLGGMKRSCETWKQKGTIVPFAVAISLTAIGGLLKRTTDTIEGHLKMNRIFQQDIMITAILSGTWSPLNCAKVSQAVG
jgi:hypothetical protein